MVSVLTLYQKKKKKKKKLSNKIYTTISVRLQDRLGFLSHQIGEVP